jgi:thiamine kinase-like enzyme
MRGACERVSALGIWRGPVSPEPLPGGITNRNYLVEDAGERYVVRLGDDLPVHQILRFNELAASRAAWRAGISPEVVHHEPGMLVLRHVAGRTLVEADVADPARLERIVPVVQRCHRDVPRHLRGPVLMFWVFHVIRDYATTLAEGKSPYRDRLPALLATAETLEAVVGPIEVVWRHNDVLAANLIDDASASGSSTGITRASTARCSISAALPRTTASPPRRRSGFSRRTSSAASTMASGAATRP